jgi:hypothetical protein
MKLRCVNVRTSSKVGFGVCIAAYRNYREIVTPTISTTCDWQLVCIRWVHCTLRCSMSSKRWFRHQTEMIRLSREQLRQQRRIRQRVEPKHRVAQFAGLFFRQHMAGQRFKLVDDFGVRRE